MTEAAHYCRMTEACTHIPLLRASHVCPSPLPSDPSDVCRIRDGHVFGFGRLLVASPPLLRAATPATRRAHHKRQAPRFGLRGPRFGRSLSIWSEGTSIWEATRFGLSGAPRAASAARVRTPPLRPAWRTADGFFLASASRQRRASLPQCPIEHCPPAHPPHVETHLRSLRGVASRRQTYPSPCPLRASSCLMSP